MKKITMLLVFLLFGCTPSKEAPTPTDWIHIGDGVYRIEDKEMGVICYTYYQHALSCFKRSDLK